MYLWTLWVLVFFPTGQKPVNENYADQKSVWLLFKLSSLPSIQVSTPEVHDVLSKLRFVLLRVLEPKTQNWKGTRNLTGSDSSHLLHAWLSGILFITSHTVVNLSLIAQLLQKLPVHVRGLCAWKFLRDTPNNPSQLCPLEPHKKCLLPTSTQRLKCFHIPSCIPPHV